MNLVFGVQRQDCSQSSVDPDPSLLGCYAMSSDSEDIGKINVNYILEQAMKT